MEEKAIATRAKTSRMCAEDNAVERRAIPNWEQSGGKRQTRETNWAMSENVSATADGHLRPKLQTT